MKLKEFNIDNTTRSRSTTPHFSITKHGLISFSVTACELVALKAGDQIVFLQDEEELENWYLAKVDKAGFVLREAKTSVRGLLLNSSALARQIINALEGEELRSSYRFLIAGKPTEFQKRKLYGIIRIRKV